MEAHEWAEGTDKETYLLIRDLLLDRQREQAAYKTYSMYSPMDLHDVIDIIKRDQNIGDAFRGYGIDPDTLRRL